MQTVAGYPTNSDVLEPTALVIVNGVPQEVESFSISRELSSSMPSQVTAGNGITAATGNVSWSVGDDVQERSAHPWDGNDFPPKPAAEVVVFAGYGDALVRQLTGSVDDVQGSIASGDVSSGLVDPIDKLNRPVTFPALLSEMPPYNEEGPFVFPTLQPIYVTDRILRECGFNATPPVTSGAVVSAPQMGSAWPEVGTLRRGNQQGAPPLQPLYEPSPWGAGLSSGDLDYIPDRSGAGGDAGLNRTVQITAKVDVSPQGSGQSFVRAQWGSAFISLTVTPERNVQALIYDGVSSWQTVCTLWASEITSARLFTLRIQPTGAMTLYADNNLSRSGTGTLPSVMASTHMSSVRVFVTHAQGRRLGGVQVNFGATSIVNAQQTAHLTLAASRRPFKALPRIEGRNALDLLKEQAQAECAAMWIDEHGHFRWRNRYVLAERAVDATLTALDDVLDIGWESNTNSVRSEVVLISRSPAVALSNMSNQIAWQGKGQSLEREQVNEEIIAADDDTDWIQVDENPRMINDVSGWWQTFNRGQGSWVGGVQTDNDGSQWVGLGGHSGFSVDMEKIADSVYKITTDAGIPVSGRTVELRTVDEDSTSAIWPSKRNFDLPVLRAKAIVEWSKLETVGSNPGPPNAPVLEHNVGFWVQHTVDLQILADWLSAQVYAPRPVLRDLSVIPDFRRQLGDVVWVEDAQNMRIRLKVLITKITTSFSAGTADQTVAGRILEVQSYGATNAQLDDHSSSRTNAGFDTLWSDATNAQLDNDPLGRG